MNLGETIYRLRTERNLSQGDLADALDVSRQSVSKWENNSAVPELEKLIKMAQIFGITLDVLVSGEVKTTTPPPPVASTNPIPGRRLVVPGIILLCFGILMALISLPLVWPDVCERFRVQSMSSNIPKRDPWKMWWSSIAIGKGKSTPPSSTIVHGVA